MVNELLNSELYLNLVLEASNLIVNSIKEIIVFFLAGNGGSAAHAQHFAAELVSRFNFDREPITCDCTNY